MTAQDDALMGQKARATGRSRRGSETRQRTRMVNVRMTPAEYALASAQAKRVGLTVSAYLRAGIHR